MYSAFKYATKKHKERQAQLLVEKTDQGGHEAQTIVVVAPDVIARTNAAASSSEFKVKEPGVKKKKKSALSPEELAAKKRSSYSWKIVLGLWGPFAL
jgi:hypothetical protein